MLGQEIGDGDGDVRTCERHDRAVSSEDFDIAVSPAELARRIRNRLSIHFDDAIHEIHDPVVEHAGPGIQAALVAPVEHQARFRHFDEERGPSRVFGTIVTMLARNDGDVGLRL